MIGLVLQKTDFWDKAGKWLLGCGKISRNNGNDLDFALGSIGIDTNEFFAKNEIDLKNLWDISGIIPGGIPSKLAIKFGFPTLANWFNIGIPIYTYISLCSKNTESVQCFSQ
ncbi:MAG: hypothetical protein MH321_14920 [Leptospiraceae bacterium]|nr:hypothetical protein [Leptospiraceae bacterium]